jgi:hypothetical protein
MIYNTPYIVHFEDILEKYSHSRGSGFVYRADMPEPKEVKEAREEVVEIMTRHKRLLSEIEDKMLDYVQEMTIQSPQVYVARTKDVKTDIEYFTAKVFWPQKGGDRKEIKIYLGKAEDFGNNTKSPKAKMEAERKMAETLRRRKDAGEI